MAKQISNAKLYFFMIGMLITGAINTLVLKGQDKSHYPDEDSGYTPKDYNHPFFQCALMFVGELLCLIVYCHDKSQRKKHPELAEEEREAAANGLIIDFNKFYFGIPALCDVCASTLMFFGLTLAAASVYQMMRGAIVVITAVFSVIFLRRKLYQHHITGVVLVIIGITIVGVAALIQDKKHETKVAGVILLILSQFFSATMFIVEEKLFSMVYVDPTQGVGLEGLFGVTYYIIILIIAAFLKVPSNVSDFTYLENVPWALFQIANNVVLLILVLLGIFSIAFFNFFGLSVTKYSSAVARSVIDTSRTVLIWVGSLILKWEDFIPLQLVGFVFLTIGTLMYNEIIVLPFWGFDQNTKKKLQAKRLEDAGLTPEEKDEVLKGRTASEFTGDIGGGGSFVHASHNVKKIESRREEDVIKRSVLSHTSESYKK